jgi:hypothetical protein
MRTLVHRRLDGGRHADDCHAGGPTAGIDGAVSPTAGRVLPGGAKAGSAR